MSQLVVRRLLVDLETPLPRHWNGGDAFRTAMFNALSMSFPIGEQFFIDSVRDGLKALPEAERPRYEAEVKGFIGQEATHRRLHGLFNGHLEKQGLDNQWEPRARRRMQRLEGVDIRAWVAATAATEHFTAILAEYLLTHEAPLAGTEERLKTLWLWHASEESEHRCTAFDLYRALGGQEKWRIRLFWFVTLHFTTDLLRQTALNLWRDGTLFKASTWASGWRTLFGREGLFRTLYRPWKAYLRADFHPAQQSDTHATDWLNNHRDAFAIVGEAR